MRKISINNVAGTRRRTGYNGKKGGKKGGNKGYEILLWYNMLWMG